jgi:GT2 family glycosyltransferase
MTAHKVSIIVPSLTGDITLLKADLARQSFQEFELVVASSIRPPAKARNFGAKKAIGEILIFIDDDIRFGHEAVLLNLIKAFEAAENVGVVGVPHILPKDSNRFQRRLAQEIIRVTLPMVETLTKTDFGIAATCWAMKRELFEKLGGFNQDLISGEDSEFLYRVNRLGLQNYIVPNSWVYHAPPKRFGELMRKFFWYGIGHCQCAHMHPNWGCGLILRNPVMALGYLLFRTIVLIPNIFFPFSYRDRSLKLGFKPLKAIASYAAAWGYVYGWFKEISRQ